MASSVVTASASASSTEQYEAHWRAAQHDSISDSGDFPEIIVMMIELLNGPKGAKNVYIKVTLHPNGTTTLVFTDDGAGSTFAEAQARLLLWAATHRVDGSSVYGHGLKKFLAKCGDYATLVWKIRSRTTGSPTILEWCGPFKGLHTTMDMKYPSDIPDFPTTGFQVEVTFQTSLLGFYTSAGALFTAIKEFICSRKTQDHLATRAYTLTVSDADQTLTEHSVHNAWVSLHFALESLSHKPLLESQGVKCLLDTTIPLIEGKVQMRYVSYSIGANKEIAGFPIYGTKKGQKNFRVHFFSQDTMIEARPWTEVMRPGGGRQLYTHRTDFVYFIPVDPTNLEHIDAQPPPSTTKVSYRREDPVYVLAIEKLRGLYETHKKDLELPALKDIEASLEAERAATGGAAAAAPAPAQEEDAASVESVAGATDLTTTLFTSLQTRGLVPERRIDVPKWIGLECIHYIHGDKHILVIPSNRKKGDLKEDLLKAYAYLQIYVGMCKLQSDAVEMQYVLNRQNVRNVEKRREEFTACLETMPANYGFPYIGCMKFDVV